MLRRHSCAIALATALLLNGSLVSAQTLYDSPQAAADALVNAIATGDEDGLRKSLGQDFRRFVPLDSVARDDVYAFLAAWHAQHKVVETSPGIANLLVGQHDWSFPAPITRHDGRWRFDLQAGLAEMKHRRIERNETAAMETLQELCRAQDQYRAKFGHAATRIVSHEGKTDGLYWDDDLTTEKSPLSDDALVMEAGTPAAEAWHGYHFRLRTPADASGCAFTAWPAARGQSGVRTFTIGPDRKVEVQSGGSSKG